MKYLINFFIWMDFIMKNIVIKKLVTNDKLGFVISVFMF